VKYLEITTKNGLGRRTVELRDKPLRIGRDRKNDIVLRDTRVSRHHCVIETINGRPLVRDLGSSRGIKVNNRRREESDLRPGDRVRIGPFMIVLREEAQAPAELRANGSASQPIWDASGESASDETSLGGQHALDLAHDSQSDSDDESVESSAATPLHDAASAHAVGELHDQIRRLEASLVQRDRELDELKRELRQLADRHAALQSQVVASRTDEAGRVDVGTVRGAIEAEHATLMSAINVQRRELTDMLAERAREVAQRAAQESEELKRRLAGLETALMETEAAERLALAEQRLTESADRLDNFASAHEQLAFEHAQVARAVQELAGRIDPLEEVVNAVLSMSNRVLTLEESADQTLQQSQQAIETANRFSELLRASQHAAEESSQLAQANAADIAEVDAKLTVQDELTQRGAQNLITMAKQLEELRQSQRSEQEQRERQASELAQAAAAVAHLRDLIAEQAALSERIARLEARMRAMTETLDGQESTASLQAGLTIPKSEMDSLRATIAELGDRLQLRIDRIEAVSKEASSHMHQLDERVRNVASAALQGSATASLVAGTAEKTAPKAKGKVQNRSDATASVSPPSNANATLVANRSGPHHAGVPASIDAEQSRQVMSRIFAPKDEQDERYKPVRDHSVIFILVLVLVFGMGAVVIMLGPWLQTLLSGGTAGP